MHEHCFLLGLAFPFLAVLAGTQESPQVRLTNGNTRCAGRVEILQQGSWGTICDDNWELSDAHVVCRQMSCGVALLVAKNEFFGAGSGPIWLNGLRCTGKESHVWKCPSWGQGQHNCSHHQDAGVICSGFVRLVGGDGHCSGRVEVNPGDGWILVSDINFTLPNAQVICEEMGCGKAVSVLGNVSKKASARVWDEEFQCVGQEPEFWLCPRVPCPGGRCHRGGFVEIVCSVNPQLRLVEGGSHCDGRVEIYHQDSWGTICDYNWDMNDAQVVCRQLGCGTALEAVVSAHFGEGSGPIWMVNVNCTGEESHVWKCPSPRWGKSYCKHNRDVGVICSGFVHLAGGNGPCSGLVEINAGGVWTPLSDGNFRLPTAQVICAELGCGKAGSVLKGNMPFTEPSAQIWAEEFQCAGQEPGLWFCPRVPCPGGRCNHSGAVHLVCSEYTQVRLVTNDTSQCAGQVEMETSAGRRTLCASHWTVANANVVCHQLGCGVAVAIPTGASFVDRGAEIWKGRFHCSGAESSLWNCPVTALGLPTCAPGNTAWVVCSGNQTQLLPQCNDSWSEPSGSAASEGRATHCSDSRQIRLVNGADRCAGRVEILQQASWGSICDDSWDLRDAHVVCRQLGCGVALEATGSAGFGEGSGPIWLDELNCTGEEAQVWRCPSHGWDRHDCRHKEDAGVICSESLALRMVSEDQECAGWLEVFYNQTWGSVCRSPMEDVTLSVICRQLGCGNSGAVNYSVALRGGSRPQWVDGIHCQKTDTSLWQCSSDPWKYRSCSSKEEAYITCAGMRPKSCPVAAPCTDKEKLRLRGGDSECSGRVEVWHAGSWGTVCDDSWSLAEAQVVCRQLGCGAALDAPGWAAFGSGNGSIWLDEVQCRGLEPSLWACAAAPWGQSDCKHEEDAGVRCSGVRTPAPPTPGITTSSSLPVSGIFSIPGILCVILGILLFLVLTILGTQLQRWRTEHQGTIDEAVYQEIDYLINPGEELLHSAGNLSDDSVTKLPYYTGDGEETGEPESAPEPPGQHVDGTGDGYDDVEELPVSEIPSSPGMRISPERPREATKSSTEKKGPSLFPRGKDSMYDDIELTDL